MCKREVWHMAGITSKIPPDSFKCQEKHTAGQLMESEAEGSYFL